MRRHTHRYLNATSLREHFNEVYDGRIDAVTEELIHDQWAGENHREPVITFTDGWRLIPNINQRKALMALFGFDTEEWLGKVITVFLHPIDKGGRTRFEKRVCAVTEEREREFNYRETHGQQQPQ